MGTFNDKKTVRCRRAASRRTTGSRRSIERHI